MNVGANGVSSHRRIEDERLITGSGTYVADLVPADGLYCAFVRSPSAHGEIAEVDLDETRQAPGVVAVFTASDLDLTDIPGATGRGPEAKPYTRPPLVRTRVRYVGDPIAIVVAETARQAADAVDLAWVDIDELPIEIPGEDLVLLFEGTTTNAVEEVFIEHGEPAPAPEISVTVQVEHQRLAPVSLETQALLAVPGPDGMRVWCSHQAPHRLKTQITNFVGIENVRVTVPDVGGAFGMKGSLFPEYLVTVAAASRLDRPVAWIQRRQDQFTGGTHGRAQSHEVTIEGTREGKITRAAFNLLAETGAYPHDGSAVPRFGLLTATGMYDIGRVEIHARTVVSNRAPTAPYRGAGRPEAALTIERGVDAFARAAGLDPMQVRLDNVVTEFPYTTAAGALYDSGDYTAALEMAAELLDIPALRAEQARRLQAGGPLLGVGIGAFVERAGGGVDSWEYAAVEVDPERQQIVVRTGSTDGGGQGHKTVWSQLAREIFEIENVTVFAGDTLEVPSGLGTFASRSAQIGASGVHRMAHQVLDTAKHRAAAKLEASADDLVYRQGTFAVVGSPGSEVSLWDLASDEPLASDEKFKPGFQTFPYGVHCAVVEVQPETGEIRVIDIVAVDDCGNVLNPMIVEGQLHGSMAQGLGQALLEEFLYDEDGQPLTTSLVGYMLPDSMSVPEIREGRIYTPAPSNPLGVKGSGEAGCIGLPPAILNAALDALAPLGVADLQMPLRPQKIWQAIQDARV